MKARVKGTELFYEVHGSGLPMLVMHGGFGPDHSYFRPWLDALGDRVQLVYYDHRGGGRSARPPSLDGVTMQTWVDDADALRAHLGFDRLLVLGHSYGGFVAQEYALSYGDRLAGLVLCCTAPAWDYLDAIDANAQARGTPEAIEAHRQLGSGPVANDATFGQLWLRMAPLYFKRYDPDIGPSIHSATAYSAAAYNQSEVALVGWSTVDRLGSITAPTLIVASRDDWVTPVAQSERMLAELPNADLVVFEESGHYPFVEEHAGFVKVISEWVAALG